MKITKPIVFFDLETTGVSFADDRIIDVALIKQAPSGEEERFGSLVHPGMPIPPEATAIHQITDEMVAGAPAFREIASKLIDFFEGCDIGGFGVARFDLPMIAAEFRRNNFIWSMEGRRVVDALTIFHRMEPRNLGAALKFYCGRPLEGAHRASADTQASKDVFWAQLERYPDLPQDMVGLDSFCNKRDFRHVDSQGKFVWKNGRAAFNFGKFKMVPIDDVARKEPSYLEWLSRDKNSPELARICSEALRGLFPKRTDE